MVRKEWGAAITNSAINRESTPQPARDANASQASDPNGASPTSALAVPRTAVPAPQPDPKQSASYRLPLSAIEAIEEAYHVNRKAGAKIPREKLVADAILATYGHLLGEDGR